MNPGQSDPKARAGTPTLCALMVGAHAIVGKMVWLKYRLGRAHVCARTCMHAHDRCTAQEYI